jgi:hypothetical protein
VKQKVWFVIKSTSSTTLLQEEGHEYELIIWTGVIQNSHQTERPKTYGVLSPFGGAVLSEAEVE